MVEDDGILEEIVEEVFIRRTEKRRRQCQIFAKTQMMMRMTS